MKFEDYGDIGLFKFGIIAPAINGTHNLSSNEKFFDEASKKVYIFKNKEYSFSKSTIKRWYFIYKKNGFNDLGKKSRNDKNKSRKLNNDTIQRIITIKENFLNSTGTSVYKN